MKVIAAFATLPQIDKNVRRKEERKEKKFFF
jgi:hypothetical protein